MKLKYLKQLHLIILFIYFLSYNKIVFSNDIVATIKPLHSLVQGILGTTEKVSLIIKNDSPHNPNLKPSEIKLMSNAKIIFAIDERLEPFLKTIDSNKKIFMSQIPNIDILTCRTNCHKTEINNIDIHMWLSTKNAKYMLKKIHSTLVSIKPEKKYIYDNNLQNILQNITNLDNKINFNLQPIKNKSFFVFHDAYQYFEKQYNIPTSGFISNPNTPLSIKHILQIKKTIENSNHKICIFLEPQFSKKIPTIISENNKNIKIGILDPIGINLTPGENLYFQLLNNISKNLLSCMS